jgi:hypothetical protein
VSPSRCWSVAPRHAWNFSPTKEADGEAIKLKPALVPSIEPAPAASENVAPAVQVSEAAPEPKPKTQMAPAIIAPLSDEERDFPL